MELRDLVRALRDREALTVRQWIADANRVGYDWARAEPLSGADAVGAAILASVIELMAERSGRAAPDWTAQIASLERPFFLVRAAESMPRLRRECEQNGPWAFRKRKLFAPPDFLTMA